MVTSPQIPIVVNLVATSSDVNFTATVSGVTTVYVTGYLSDTGSWITSTNLVNGETVKVQAQKGGVWVDLFSYVTILDIENFGNGSFVGSFAVNPTSFPPGVYPIRSYYAGNASKGLESCTSPSRNLTVASYASSLIGVTIGPPSGQGTFTITWAGQLSDNGSSTPSSLINNESIKLEALKSGVWTDLATAATAAVSGVNGKFSGTFVITPTAFPKGTYQFRTEYLGNPSKGVTASLSLESNINADNLAEVSPVLTYVVVAGVGIGALAAIYYFFKRKKGKKRK